MAGEPLFAGGDSTLFGEQQGADAVAVAQARDGFFDSAADDDGEGAGSGSQAGGTDLCLHSAAAQHASTTTRHGIELGVAGAPFVDQLGIGIFAGVFVEQAELVGEDDQSVGFDQVGHQRAQGVVVAKADFVGDDGVVFVNDGHHAEIEQRSQGAAGIEVALAIRQVIVGQQDLCGVQIMSFELGFPGLHQPHLTNGGCSLKFMQLLRANCPTQPAHAFSHRTRRHHHHFNASSDQLCNLVHPQPESSNIQTSAIVG